MILGEPVPGPLTEGWFFVTGDAHDINRRVRQEFPECRLVCNPQYWDGDQRLGVVEWARVDKFNATDAAELEDLMRIPIHANGGLWLLASTPRGEDGEPLCGEPNEAVLVALRMFDRRRRQDEFNAKRWHEFQTNQIRLAEEREREAAKEVFVEAAEKWHHKKLKANGDRKPSIWVPETV